MAEPTLKAYNPTWRDKLGGLLMGDGRASPERRNFVQGLLGSSGLGNTGMGLLDFTPAGNVLGAQESAQKGDYKGAAMNAMFLGPAARTADHVALATAQRMAEQGADRAAIHAQTGWFTGVDGKWRFEIPDNKASVDLAGKAAFGQQDLPTRPVGDFINHPKLDAADDITGDTTANVRLTPGPMEGSYHPARNVGSRLIPDHISVDGATNGEVKSALLHEMQHSVQKREGFSLGPGSADDLPFDEYHRLASEVEARNVQARMNMTPEQRMAKPPWETQDVPDYMQIIQGLGR